MQFLDVIFPTLSMSHVPLQLALNGPDIGAFSPNHIPLKRVGKAAQRVEERPGLFTKSTCRCRGVQLPETRS